MGPVASAYLFNEFYKGFWTATQARKAFYRSQVYLHTFEEVDAGERRTSASSRYWSAKRRYSSGCPQASLTG